MTIGQDPVTGAVSLLDNRSTACAVGLIKAAERMGQLPAGTILEVLSRDRFAPWEIPLWAERDGHRLQLQERVGRWPRRYWRFRILKVDREHSQD